MHTYRIDFGIPAEEMVMMGRDVPLRAAYAVEEAETSAYGIAFRSPRFDALTVEAPSGRTMALEVIVAADGSGLHGTVYLRTGFFDVQSTPDGLEPAECAAWEVAGRSVAFQIAFVLPGSAFDPSVPFGCDVALDDPEHFLRHGGLDLDAEHLDPILDEARAVFDRFLAQTPDLASEADRVLGSIRVDILRRQAELVVEQALVRAEQLRREADDLEAGFPQHPAPRG
ncbi:hypothetical protein [Methylobacterium fujisawaense]